MKKVLFAFVVSGIGVVGLNAQTVKEKKPAEVPAAVAEGKHKGGGKEKEVVEKLKEVGATDAQIEKLKPIFKDEHTQMMGLRKDTALTKEERKKKMKELHKLQEGKIIEILGVEKANALKTAMKKQEGHEAHKAD